MGSKGSQKTTETYTPNSAVGASGTQALNMAQGVANLPFQQQVAPIAGFTPAQLQAFQQTQSHQGYAEPYINAANNLYGQSAQPIGEADINQYLNPYANYVMEGLNDTFGQQRSQATGQLTQAAGGVGADRIGVAQSNLAKQQGNVAGQALSGIYGQALSAAQQDQQRRQSAAAGIGGLGMAGQQAAMQGDQALLAGGNQQQAQAQNVANAPYQWDLARIAQQYQVPQWLSGITAGTAPALGGTKTAEYPAPSPWGTIAGLGLTAAGAFTGNPGMMAGGLGGLKGGQQTGGMTASGYGNTGGWNPNVSGGYVYPSARGGAIGRSAGGRVTPMDVFQSFWGGGMALPRQDGGGVDEPFPSFADRFSAVGDDPRVAAAMEFNNPLPDEANTTPPPSPMPSMIANGPGGGEEDGMPPSAMGFAPRPQRPPPQALQPYGGPTGGEEGGMPGALEEIPKEQESGFAQSPGFALMTAGLGTLAAAGKRDSRGLPLSPWAAIGEGGLHGVKTAQTQQTQAQQRRRIQLEAQRLLNQAEHQRQSLGEQRRWHDLQEGERRDRQQTTIQERRDRNRDILEERRLRQQENVEQRAERERTLRLRQQQDALKPVPMGADQFGFPRYGIRDPKTGVLIPLDPKTGQPDYEGAGVPRPEGAPARPPAAAPRPGATGPGPTPPNEMRVEAPTENEEAIPASARQAQAPHLRPEVLESLEPHHASQVKAIAEGRMPLPSGAALRAPAMQRLLYWVSQYDPTFDAVNYNARSRTRNDFTAGVTGKNVVAFNTAINHLDTFEKTFDRLKNTRFPMYNRLANTAATETGDVEMQRARDAFHVAKTALAGELAKAFRGSTSAVFDVKEWGKSFDDAKSPQALRESVKQTIDLLKGRIQEVQNQYDRGMGTTNAPLPLLSPNAIPTLERIEKSLEQSEAERRPARGQKAGKKKGPQEGDKRTIGDRNVVFRNGQWTEE